MKIKLLRNSGFSIDQIKLLKNDESVQAIVSERLNNLEKEKETCGKLFDVLSQVDKSNDLTFDELIEALENPLPVLKISLKDETAPLRYLFNRAKKIVTVLSICLFIFLLSAFIIFFAFDGPQWIEQRTQSGEAVLMVRKNGEFLTTEHFAVDDSISAIDGNNGYSFDMDYGEIRAKVFLYDGSEIEFGLINTNNWHYLNIVIDVMYEDNCGCVRQTVTYKTDNQRIEYLVTNRTVTEKTGVISVFHDGV